MTKDRQLSTRIVTILAIILFSMIVGFISESMRECLITGAVTAVVVELGRVFWKWSNIVAIFFVVLVVPLIWIPVLDGLDKRSLQENREAYDKFQLSFGPTEISRFAQFARSAVEKPGKKLHSRETMPSGKILFIWIRPIVEVFYPINIYFDRKRWEGHLRDVRKDLRLPLAQRASEVDIIVLVERKNETVGRYFNKTTGDATNEYAHFCSYDVRIVDVHTANVLDHQVFRGASPPSQVTRKAQHGAVVEAQCSDNDPPRDLVYQWLRDPLHTRID